MEKSQKYLNKAGKFLFSTAVFLFFAAQSFAGNVFDSDMSNGADTNKSSQNVFWFFVCVAFLSAVVFFGLKTKYTPVNRKYRPGSN